MQMAFNGFVKCDNCLYGKHLGAMDYGCASQRRRNAGLKMVHNLNKDDFDCEFAEAVFEKKVK
jgi:hypothetical protein